MAETWPYILICALCPFAETSPQTGNPLADGSHPAAVLLCADSDHRLDLHGAHGEEEAPVGGSVQPQCSGAGWGSAGDGQHAQSPTRGKTHMTQAERCCWMGSEHCGHVLTVTLWDRLNTWAELKDLCGRIQPSPGGEQVVTQCCYSVRHFY